jgi:hypothetical protein
MYSKTGMQSECRSGLTRVEVIVLILIALIVVTLLMPVVGRLREVSAQSECKARLRAIGIASHNYHNDFNRLPSGYYSAVRDHGNHTTYAEERGPHIGCLAVLLPYLENDAVFNQLCNTAITWPVPSLVPAGTRPLKIEDKTEYLAWWRVPENLLATSGRARIKAFTCPSDDVDDASVTTGIVSLQISNGSFAYVSTPNANLLGRTNYLGVAGAAGDFDRGRTRESFPDVQAWEGYQQSDTFERFIGCLYNRSTLTLGQLTVQDGTSNTLLFGETLGSTGVGPRTTAFTWLGAGTMGTAYGLGRGNRPGLNEAKPPPLGSMPAPDTTGASWFRFSSRHARGVHFCFGDASVRTIRFQRTAWPDLTNSGGNGSNWSVLQQLAGRRDGFNN